jgi:hypothetical protein
MRKFVLMMLLVSMGDFTAAIAAEDRNAITIKRLVQHLNSQGIASYFDRAFSLLENNIQYSQVRISDANIDTCRMQYKEISEIRMVSTGDKRKVVVLNEFDMADIQKVLIDESENYDDENLSKKLVIPAVRIEFKYDAASSIYGYPELNPNRHIVSKSLSIKVASKDAAKKAVDLFISAEKYCKKFVK